MLSMRSMPDGTESPYELNVTYFSALFDDNDSELGENRFLCSQLLPFRFRVFRRFIFIPSLPLLMIKRALQRRGVLALSIAKNGNLQTLNQWLGKQTTGSRVFDWYVTILRKRSSAPAFHPDAAQEILILAIRYLASSVHLRMVTSLLYVSTISCPGPTL